MQRFITNDALNVKLLVSTSIAKQKQMNHRKKDSLTTERTDKQSQIKWRVALVAKSFHFMKKNLELSSDYNLIFLNVSMKNIV